MPSPPAGPGGSNALSALLGGSGPSAQATAPNQIMSLMMELEQDVQDLSRALPGSGDIAQQILQLLDQWKAMAIVTIAPPPAQMPGAASML